MSENKKTSLYDTHVKAGAKMVPFAGYYMPVSYTTISEEHMAVRSAAGLFDVSHMGEFVIKGKGAFELVQKVTSNNVSRLKVGDAQYSCLPNLNGGIVDDLIVYCMDDNIDNPEYLLVVNASNIEKDWNWISDQNSMGATMEDRSDKTGLLALQGPKAQEILQSLTDTKLDEIGFYKFKIGSVGHIEDVIISATGYTGSGGFELYAEDRYLDDLWYLLMKKGEAHGLIAAGLGARDTLRLEMGYCLYGNDIDDHTSPIEAGLSWIVKTKKGEFNSKEIFAKQKKDGVDKKLIAFKLVDRRVPRKDYPILSAEGQIIGKVTSGTMSPCLDLPIGMGLIDSKYSDLGGSILIDTGRKQLKAEICKLPFVDPAKY